MRFMRRLSSSRRAAFAVSLAALATLSLSARAAERENATPAEAERLIANATIDFSHGDHHFYEYYAIDGIARGDDGSGEHRISGHWRVRPDGTVCFLHDDPNQSGCVFVQVDGESIEFHRVDGIVEGPFKLEKGNPHRL